MKLSLGDKEVINSPKIQWHHKILDIAKSILTDHLVKSPILESESGFNSIHWFLEYHFSLCCLTSGPFMLFFFLLHQLLCVSFTLIGSPNSPSRHFITALSSKLGQLIFLTCPIHHSHLTTLGQAHVLKVLLDISLAIISSPAHFFTMTLSLIHSSKSPNALQSHALWLQGAPSADHWFLNSSHTDAPLHSTLTASSSHGIL